MVLKQSTSFLKSVCMFENLVSSYGPETSNNAWNTSPGFENLVSSYGSETCILYIRDGNEFENLVSSYGSETICGPMSRKSTS